MGKIDTINVDVTVTNSVSANGADLLVTVRGSSLVMGNAAVKKAREVRALAESLAGVGVGEEDIHIEGVQASVSSGLISKSSTANFKLRICCHDLDALGDVIGAVTSVKQADLSAIEWRYPDAHQLSKELLSQAVPQAREKAELIAELLGVKLLGVHSLVEKYRPAPQERVVHLDDDRSRIAHTRAMTAEDLGVAVSNRKPFGLSLNVCFRVGALG